MKPNAFVIFIIVGKTNVLWAGQHSIKIKMIGFNQKMIGFKYSVITTTQLVKNNNEESVKQQTLCQIKPRDIQIAQHQFNSKTVYKKQRTSSHVT